MEYEVLSPWAEKSEIAKRLQPRVSELGNKTIGMFYLFMDSHVFVLKEIERQLTERFPTAKFSYYQYPVETSEVANDPKYIASFKKWLKGVDTVISAYGSGTSPGLYLAYNTAYIEKLGKPAVIITSSNGTNNARSGVSAKGFPELRLVVSDLPMIGFDESQDRAAAIVRPGVAAILDDLIIALTKPLTAKEKSTFKKVKKPSRIVFKGNLENVNRYFYKSGWSYGMPIIPPTEEAVREMLMGTDLPPNHVVAIIPPMSGKATVEKIAVNAVMAGCLPTYMPVLIAGVKAMMDNSKIKLEGYTCSAGNWEPIWIINGPIRNELHINSGMALMSPYYRANTAIGHALGLIVMNIGGVRPGIEEGAGLGHEGKFGVCFGENEEMSPWEPLHVQYGFNKEDSTITSFWPTVRQLWQVRGAEEILNTITEEIRPGGFDPGCALIVGPLGAKSLAEAGWTKKDFKSYIVEYARRPLLKSYRNWLIYNHHIPKEVVVPVESTKSTIRQFLSSEHLIIVVAGATVDIAAYGGGGDHGGPSTKKIELPANWNELVKKYEDIVPTYAPY
jgi:hypothetical protein